MSPADVDDLEIWQLASALGLASERADDGKPDGGRDLTAERIAAAKGKGPKPRPRPPGSG